MTTRTRAIDDEPLEDRPERREVPSRRRGTGGTTATEPTHDGRPIIKARVTSRPEGSEDGSMRTTTDTSGSIPTALPSQALCCPVSMNRCSSRNVAILGDEILAADAAADPSARWVVFDLEAVGDVDSTATERLLELVAAVHRREAGYALARQRLPVAEYLDRAACARCRRASTTSIPGRRCCCRTAGTPWRVAGHHAAGAAPSNSTQEDRP